MIDDPLIAQKRADVAQAMMNGYLMPQPEQQLPPPPAWGLIPQEVPMGEMQLDPLRPVPQHAPAANPFNPMSLLAAQKGGKTLKGLFSLGDSTHFNPGFMPDM